jgi:hypothetical protein
VTIDLQPVYWALNGTNATDIVFWTADHLWREVTSAANDLCRASSGLAEVNADITIAPATSTATLDARCQRVMSAFHKSTDGGSELIRHADHGTVSDLEALGNWSAHEDNFIRVVAPSEGENGVTVYPRMPAGRTVALQVLGAMSPADINAGSPTIDLPEAARPYLTLRTIAAARDHDGPARMPEVSAKLQQVADMLGNRLRELWGE